MAKNEKTNIQIIVHKEHHRKLKTEQQEPHIHRKGLFDNNCRTPDLLHDI